MSITIDWSYDYQVVDMHWFKDTSVHMTVVTHYWQRGEGKIHWREARNISDKLARCRKFRNENQGTWFVDAPASMPDDLIRKALRRLIAGDTIKVRL